jgi:hypothetical protein
LNKVIEENACKYESAGVQQGFYRSIYTFHNTLEYRPERPAYQAPCPFPTLSIRMRFDYATPIECRAEERTGRQAAGFGK